MHIIQGPSLLILTFYGLVMFQLWCSAPVRPTRSASHQRLQRRVTRLILTVITVYIICWLPHWVIQIVLLLSPPDTMSDLLMVMILLSSCLQYANSGRENCQLNNIDKVERELCSYQLLSRARTSFGNC